MKGKLFIGIIFILASISIITANAQIGSSRKVNSLIGTIIDQKTGSPIPDLDIYIDKTKQTATDEVGKFIIRNLPSGSNIITVKSPGYNKVRKTVYIRKDVTRVLIKLKRIKS